MKKPITIVLLAVFMFMSAVAAAQAPADLQERNTAEGVRFHYVSSFAKVSETLQEESAGQLTKLSASLGVPDLAPVDVWVVRNIGDYFTWRGEPNRAPEWAVGLSLSNRKTILILNGVGPGGEVVDLKKTYQHELAHVAVDAASGGKGVPRWFHEGFAVMHAEEWSAERSNIVSRAASTGTLSHFKELSRTFPEHQHSASLAYAQAFHFVRYIGEQHGQKIYGQILADLRRGKDFETAYKHQTGKSLGLEEAQWRKELEDSTSAWSLLHDEMFLFFGASLLFLVAWWVRRTRTAKKLKSMDVDNPHDGWDYDESQYPLPGDK